eukprot:m.359580 g.359580  ORF g.359580 m.359580 type:complete len:823 (+) comp18636_c0_seq1:179-2647(+)
MASSAPIHVVKRNGTKEKVQVYKVQRRIEALCEGLAEDHVDAGLVSLKVLEGIKPDVTTVELDELAADICASLTTSHPDYAVLGARIAVSNLHKETEDDFLKVIDSLHKCVNPETKQPAPLIADDVFAFAQKHADRLNAEIDYTRDMSFNFFGFKTLERSYLLKINRKIVERPQHMFMRVSLGIHGDDIESVIETYHSMSLGLYTHASPTLFNAGTPRPQMSSCFLLTMKDDSIEGIYDTLKTCAMISKTAGGIGISMHNIRARGSYIAGTNGHSNGLVPMLRVFNNTARYVDQGGNKRPGAFATYLEPWHADISEFLNLKKNTGIEEERARDLFYALWVPDLFMERVERNQDWTLMCPHECPGLSDVYGDEFVALYERYEREGRGRRTIPAQKLWFEILESQTETGTPYMLYKDACNSKSNQKNLGTIKSSNLCTEIIEYSSPDEVAVCNLASIALNKFVKADKTFDYERLHATARSLTRNLNRIIDVNHYPVPEARKSNMRHRPIGIGVQGLADCFALMRLPFTSEEARKVNSYIFETIYHGALTESAEIAKVQGHYETFPGSPASKGIFQFDMWGKTAADLSGMYDWDSLREQVKATGIRNSLLLAPMPTASTANILGNNESVEPFHSNIFSRRVLSGSFQVVNKHLLKDLVELGLWSQEVKQQIILGEGSVQHIECIPAEIKALYKTVWELKQRDLIDMAADRGAFIDQSQSFSVHIAEPNFGKLTSMHFYGWKKGLKTGMYYLRSRAATQAIRFTVDAEKDKALKDKQRLESASSAADAEDVAVPSAPLTADQLTKEKEDAMVCSLTNPEGCLMCSA